MADKSETNVLMRARDAKFRPEDLVIVSNLVGLGYNACEIGMILGYQGKALDGWKISAGKTLGEDARKAVKVGLEQADSLMVKDLITQAVGYEWEEVKTTYKPIEDFNTDTGEPEVKMVAIAETRTRKRQPGNSRLAELLVTNRLPALFKRVSEIKKSSFEAKAELSEDQISLLIGRLLEATETKRKTIESATI